MDVLFHPTTTEYLFFSSYDETFSKVNHILGHRIYLLKIKRREIIQCLFLDYNGYKLAVNRKIAGKSQTKQHIYELHMGQIRKIMRCLECLKTLQNDLHWKQNIWKYTREDPCGTVAKTPCSQWSWSLVRELEPQAATEDPTCHN